MLKNIFVGLVCLVSFSTSGITQEIGSWWMYFGQNRLSDHWSIWTEAQYRSHDHGENIEQLLLRTAAIYQLSKNSTFGLGYGYIGSYDISTDIKSPTSEEGRIFQQYIHKHRIPFISFEHRFRVEQRWVSGVYKNRYRYRLFLTIPLHKRHHEGHTWFLGLYDEIFINGHNPHFDRNRFYAALGYQFNEYTNLQAGMLNQMVTDDDKWYFQLALTWNPDFRKEVEK